ncbi:MAG: hypothetical protein H0X37_04535 [Herpetosiphonaceae bacterium]|nr:hypothetical protein [Herpetosiphonaceae bacterium]
MSLLLNWALIALALFNTMSLLWLGLAVLLNAERHNWVTWATGGSMVLGGLLYAAHVTVIGRSGMVWSSDLQWWWQIGALPVLGAPYVWYVVTVGYTGVLRLQRQRVLLMAATAAALIGLVLHAAGQVASRQAGLSWEDAIILVMNPIFSSGCIGLALLALRQPAASDRLMGDLARQRARPWLTASALVLLVINLSFIGTMVVWAPWSAPNPVQRVPDQAIMGFDLLISSLVAVTVVLTGQAIVRYEIFTGKALPRGGLFTHWRRTLLLAGGYGSLLAVVVKLPLQIDPISYLALTTVVITLFYALLSRQAYGEYERSMQRLRPWIGSQQRYEQLLQPTATPPEDGGSPLRALCEDVLDAERVYLLPLGTLGPLLGSGFAYPPVTALPVVTGLIQHFATPELRCIPLEPGAYGGAIWAVPLWGERGLVGLLLLGPRCDGGLYTQEAIDVARLTGERLVDTEASAEMARRLMRLQRARLAETQLLDRRTRRVLHDDVLPQLHTIMLELSSTPATASAMDRAVGELGTIHGAIAQLLHALPPTATAEVAQLGVLGALRQAIERELASAFDGITWQIEPGGEAALKSLPPLTAEVVFYAGREAVRNAAQHGRDSAPDRTLQLWICVSRRGTWEIAIRDDGVGWGQAQLPAVAGRASRSIAR